MRSLQPMTWITDPTRFDFGNADKHVLLMAPCPGTARVPARTCR